MIGLFFPCHWSQGESWTALSSVCWLAFFGSFLLCTPFSHCIIPKGSPSLPCTQPPTSFGTLTLSILCHLLFYREDLKGLSIWNPKPHTLTLPLWPALPWRKHIPTAAQNLEIRTNSPTNNFCFTEHSLRRTLKLLIFHILGCGVSIRLGGKCTKLLILQIVFSIILNFHSLIVINLNFII